MRKTDDVLTAALDYRKKGFSVIPIQPNKKPYLKWEKFQQEKADERLIREWWENWPDANIAIVTGAISGLNVIDVDSEQGMKDLEELLPDSLITPTARTPRGGWHFYFKAKDGIGNTTGFIPGCDFRGKGGYIIAPPSKNYTWMQELSIGEVSPAELPNAIDKFFSLYRGDDTPQHFQGGTSSICFEKGHRDATLFHIANYLVKGGMPIPEIQQTLTSLASRVCNPPFPEKEIPAKIESAIKRSHGRNKALSDEVREWVLSSDGVFLSSDVVKCLQVSSREEKKNVSKILSRLMQEGLIERAGSKNGSFRRVNTECDVIDWENASGVPLEIKWPLELEKLVHIYPKSIAVFAGVQNAGKTALALNLAYMNRDRFKVQYLSSEMGGDELKIRLEGFNQSKNEWKKIDFRERSQNFSDVVSPHALNIIDYYEIDKDFWHIAGDLRRVYERLTTGIAVVCLQKTQGKDAGRGGDFGMEKPRLYVNIDPDPPRGGILTIRKGKAWASNENPNFKKLRFKIVKGSEIIRVDDWYME